MKTCLLVIDLQESLRTMRTASMLQDLFACVCTVKQALARMVEAT